MEDFVDLVIQVVTSKVTILALNWLCQKARETVKALSQSGRLR